MKWRIVLVATIAILVAIASVIPAHRWWAYEGLVLLVAAMLYERYDERQSAKGNDSMEDWEGLGIFIGICLLSLVVGCVWSWMNGLRWTSPIVGIVSAMAFFFFSMACSNAHGEAHRPRHTTHPAYPR